MVLAEAETPLLQEMADTSRTAHSGERLCSVSSRRGGRGSGARPGFARWSEVVGRMRRMENQAPGELLRKGEPLRAPGF